MGAGRDIGRGSAPPRTAPSPRSSTQCRRFAAQLDTLLPVECRLLEIEPAQHVRSTSSLMRPASRSAMNVLRSAASISSRNRRNAAAGLSPISSSVRPSRSHAELRRRVFQPRSTSAARSCTSVASGLGQQLVEPVGRRPRRLVLGRTAASRSLLRVVALHAEQPDEPRQRQPVQQQRADHDDEREEHQLRASRKRRRPTIVVSGTAARGGQRHHAAHARPRHDEHLRRRRRGFAFRIRRDSSGGR